MDASATSLLVAPERFFDRVQPRLRPSVLVVIGTSLALGVPTLLYGDLGATGPVRTGLTWGLGAVLVGVVGWVGVTAFAWLFVRRESGYWFGRLLRYVAWTGVPLAMLGLVGGIGAVVAAYLGTGSVVTSGQPLSMQPVRTIVAIANVVAIVWQGRLLLPAIQVGSGVDRQLARGPVTFYVLGMVALTWLAMGWAG